MNDHETKRIEVERVCPWYIGYFLINPIRKLYHNPLKILGPYVKPGMRILETGPGMGFFSLPLARLVGETGRVFCVDVQEKMMRRLRHRAIKANLIDRIEARVCIGSSLQIKDLKGSIDFALAFAMVHEVPDQKQFLVEVYESLRKGGMLLVSEPSGHVDKTQFDRTLMEARKSGFREVRSPNIRNSVSVVLGKG